ncbi:MAG: DUF4340 domain-containing protein [Pseudomonadota bacterium]
MSKRNLLNLGLLAFIGVLVLLVVYEPGIEKPPELPTLLQLDKAAVKQIAIQRDGQQDIELLRQADGNWQMAQPIPHAADQYRIDSLLRITTIKSLSSFTAEPDKLSAYKLAQPQVTLTLNGNITIAFGGSTPLDQRRYVMVNRQVHLISDTLYYHLIGSFPTFLRKQLLDEGGSIDGLELPGLSLSWHKDRWQLQPQPESVSADQVTRLLDQWKLASALEIKPYDEQPGEKISIKLSGKEQPQQLLLTSREPDLILARPELGIQYHLNASSAGQLLQLPSMEEEAEESAGEPDPTDETDRQHDH